MTILIVDDEKNIRNIIKKYASYEGYNSIEAENGLEAIEVLKNNDIDLVVMDIMMDEMDGFTAIRKIREFSSVPCIMLSAKSKEYDKVRGFELGIDDYVIKPFSSKELLLRVNAILKRTNTKETNNVNKTYAINSLKIDLEGRIVYIEDEIINLTPKEYELLVYLIINKGKALSRELILENVWGYSFYGEDRTIDTHIKSLRKALKGEAKHIYTIRGLGYRFDENV